MNKFPIPLRPREKVSLLVVGEPEVDLRFLHHILTDPGWNISHAGDLAACLRHLRSERVQIVLCERDLADGNWRALLEAIQTLEHPPALVVTSDQADEYLWSEVLNLGGYDVLQKPFDVIEVHRVLSLARHSLQCQGETRATSAANSPAG
ncbi:MAG: response regulator [Bryobacterales bacterium]|nr:response regulator [Bryobacterales bacterium]